MDRIILDDSLCSRLYDSQSVLPLFDSAGHVLGYFVPVAEADAALYAWARREFTDEEVEQARREPGGFTLDEVLADLREP